MRLGIIADIHEAVEPLERALDRFRQEGVDEVVHLGDVCAMNRDLGPTTQLLQAAGVPGVWGNHDFGLCGTVEAGIRQHYAPGVLEYMATLQPTLVRDDCLFTHVEPWLDPYDVMQLWYFDGPPDPPAKLARSFQAAPQRVLFSGHMHRWLLADEEGVLPWDGEVPVVLAPPRRFLVVVHALALGHAAVYDTATGALR